MREMAEKVGEKRRVLYYVHIGKRVIERAIELSQKNQRGNFISSYQDRNFSFSASTFSFSASTFSFSANTLSNLASSYMVTKPDDRMNKIGCVGSYWEQREKQKVGRGLSTL